MRTIRFSAFHGTKKSIAEKIVNSREFNPGITRPDHWLGQGSYFFREDFDQAMIWARHRYKNFSNNKGDSPSVVEIVVEAPEHNVLNLDSRGGIVFLEQYIQHLMKERKLSIKGTDEVLKKATIACFVFSTISKEEKWVITRTFPVPSIFDNSHSLSAMSFEHKGLNIDYSLQGTQVCVKNKKAIDNESIRSHSEDETNGNISVIPTKKETISDELFR